MSECEKLNKHIEEWNAIYPFLEWLGEQGIELCRMDEELRKEGFLQYVAVGKRIQDLLYEYFDIDVNKLEKERRELLDQIRKAQNL